MTLASYVPYDLKVSSITSTGVWITWDLHNTPEHQDSTYYKLYVSTDGGSTWSDPVVCNRNIHFEPLKSSYFWVAVSAVINGQETSQSQSLMVMYRIGDTNAAPNNSIAVGTSGEPASLLVDSSGALVVTVNGSTGGSGSVDTSLLAKDSTVANLNSSITPLAKDTTVQGIQTSIGSLAKDTTVSGIGDTVSDWKDTYTLSMQTINAALASLKTAVSNLSSQPKLLKTEAVQMGVGTDGRTITVSWAKHSIVDRVTVIKEAGDCQNWSIELFDCHSDLTPRRTIFREEYNSVLELSNRLDILKSFAYINTEGLAEITLRIVPDSGTNNNFYVCITGTEARA